MSYSNPFGGYEKSDQDIIIDGCRLIMTSMACPEQYDVFDENTGEQIGYLRLRGGWFRADVPNHRGETVYEANPSGDGIFDDDERMDYLTKAVKAIKEQLKKQKNENE
jgi:hypothetical protein